MELTTFFFLVFAIGLALGSFSNVYFFRLPLQLSIVRPHSFCPNCRQPIRWYDNIPVLSFLFLKGRCRNCGTTIPWNYPANELMCGLMFMLVALRFRNDSLMVLSAFLIFSFILFLIAGIDFVTYRQSGNQYGIIPDHLILILSAAGLLFSWFNPFFGESWWLGFVSGLGAVLLMFSFRWLGQLLFKREALGLGDVKMMGAVALWLGWNRMIGSLIIGSAAGALISLFLIYRKRIDRYSAIPFGPYLALGALCALLFLY